MFHEVMVLSTWKAEAGWLGRQGQHWQHSKNPVPYGKNMDVVSNTQWTSTCMWVRLHPQKCKTKGSTFEVSPTQ